ncbi:hormogonium polysaccharide biosynthesis protein HpsA [Mastigocladopsis repens]|uniref:hormogonium polysaccharide biosynthesis protein HpsA n=1 Tax=Mastigocladopsis repens TaxID=221287 RepID=UPI000307C691|nr:hormogonium polysaccharide biosynthesis protein HpsA [Mastigocladopsis repens]
MSRNRRLIKIIIKFTHKFIKHSVYTIKKQIVWLLRALFLTQKRRRATVNAGFVLPTVAMVALVVVLLTTAILLRSFDRSQNASNVRVNQAVLNAALPALDRAKAKLNKLFQDAQLPRATPTDNALESTLKTNIDKYTFGDETQLKLTYNSDELRTGWMYPVDTDNNGKFDSYTLYGVYFKNPPASQGKFTRARNPLEARTPPMIGGNVSGNCNDIVGTSATLVGSTGWFNTGGKLKKSFFVYTANVPITNSGTLPDKYERYKGNRGFSAIEYQQDRVQLPLVNNAVVYEDDIELTPGPVFNLNGRIFTNSNFLTGGVNGVTLYQVSSKASCFYEEDNAKIIVGGNLGAGKFTDSSDVGSSRVHLYKGKGVDPATNAYVKDNKSVDAAPRDIAYNSLAYVQRINRLVTAQMANLATSDPQEVKDGIISEKNKLGLSSYTSQQEEEFRRNQLERYFRRRTRRITYAEVPFNSPLSVVLGAYAISNPLQGSGDALRPPDAWMYPTNPDDGKTATGYATLALKTNGNKLLPSATEPTKLQKDLGSIEQYLGDRALIGNNLPQIWWDKVKGKFVGPNPQDTQDIKDTEWDNGEGTRTRRTRIEQLADLGATDRDKDWELAAAKVPVSSQDSVGGLRVVTGAGIYLPQKYTTRGSAADTNFSQASTEIWSDMMPVASDKATEATATSQPYSSITLPNPNFTPYLRMRATAVYHYKATGYDEKNPKPIACVSSYYDPTNSTTARNKVGLPDVSLRDRNLGAVANRNLTGLLPVTINPGNSNNGVVYGPPTRDVTYYQAVLNYQAQLKYPNGRWVNELLKNALPKTNENRTLSEKSAIDSALCSLEILDGSISPTDTVIPHGAIMETAFLDARQIKAIHTDNSATTALETFTNADGGATVPSAASYDLPKEDRQPLEIRTTVLDIDLLRQKTIGSSSPAQEYLVPNSGIIYATRNDALLDLSASSTGGSEAQKSQSPVDFILDPTRRPNAIMLINGSKIWRVKEYREAEKGLILASNLPVYIKGDFNLHQNELVKQEEFTEALTDNWSNFYTRSANQLNPNFACRPGDPRLSKCLIGDEWRPASVLADSITLLSNNFRLGYRNEGDYDLNDNLGGRKSIGNNANVPSFEWFRSDDGFPKDLEPNITIQSQTFQGSSYLNNFVTPIQRRAKFNEYVMEVCLKLPVSQCTPNDWKVDPANSTSANAWSQTGNSNGIIDNPITSIKSGTTAIPPEGVYQGYPRRVAFQRDKDGNLILDLSGRPIPMGINSSGKVQAYPYGSGQFPRLSENSNALWFRTTTNTSNPKQDNDDSDDPADTPLLLANELLTPTPNSQPRVLPVVQINNPFGTPTNKVSDYDNKVGPPNTLTANWLQIATETTFNLVAVAGDTPARPTEDNGGLHNFVRFLENWNPTREISNAFKARISGSFIQIKRSAYATAPFYTSISTQPNSYQYKIQGNDHRAPFYLAPTRQWGYDVGLLSQSPDLFAQKLVRIPDDLPDEFFREVGRDDAWVQTLLCAKKTDNTYAIDADQRPCK